MSFQDRNKQRQCPRNRSLNIIQFCFVNDSPGESRLGTTINISNTGMCLYTFNRLNEGQNIIIKNDVSSLFQKANVRWVQNYGKNFCKAGLMFIE